MRSLLAVLLGVAAALLNNHEDVAPRLVRLAGLVVGSAFAVWAARRSIERDQRLDQIALVAEAAQVAILHPVPRRVGDYAVAVRYVSAAREAVVGGDFYEVVETAGGVRVLVGDVRGKGLPAVRLAATALGAFRETVYDRDLDDVARAMDLMLHNDKNTPPTPVIQPPVLGSGKSTGKKTCAICKEDY